MIIHCIEAKLGVVECWHEPAQGNTKLTAIRSLLIFLRSSNVCPRAKRAGRICRMREVFAMPYKSIITPSASHISGGEEGATVVRHGAMPLELVKGFHGQVFGQTLGQVEHLDRQQTFLQLCARTAESGGVDRVDGVDAVLDEYTFTPADYLTTQTDVTGILADEIVVIDESVQQLNTGALLQRVTAGVADVIEALAAVLGLEVVPVVATDERAGVTVAHFQIVGTLEDLG